jgi:hypothetical protein
MASGCGHGGEEGRRGRRWSTHQRLGAYLVGMARQCPRGQPGAAWGRLHRQRHCSTRSTHRGFFHLCRSATATTSITHRKHHASHCGGSRARRQPEPAEPYPMRERDLLGEGATAKSIWWRGRGSRGAPFSLGGGGGGRRRRSESAGDDDDD